MQRREPPVRAAREIGRHHMRVQLRVKCPAHPMPVGHRDQALPGLGDLAAGAATHLHRVVLEVGKRRDDRLVMGPHQRAPHRVRRKRGQHAHRLRRRKREIQRRDQRIPQRRPQPQRGVARIHARDQRIELLPRRSPLKAQRVRA